ncbi:phage baseplate assembly protein V, partial [Bizionia paragorgiae]|uniref:phage baseplate assembly protein V n=1 Tax=Bizionia paragorgiae TaxID=283786 RepID=UPI00299D7F71
RITSITHTNTENGDYENQFQGVTAELDAYPNTNINAFPKSESQTARVMENADPDGIGRIRVQFPWQRITGEMTPWIRIVTPHAGDDKGFHFIPEINEEVLIGFEGGNAEHPYVMGSLYNGGGKAGAFQNANNDIKAIKTRSGHTLKFTEDESIILTDKSGNILQFDTTGSNITITAPETMTFNCKNMLVNVEENLTTTVGMNKTESVGMNSNESTGMMKSTTVGMNANMMVMGNLMEFIQGDLTSEVVKGREESAAEIKITSNQGNITKNAKGQIQNNSGEKGNNF